MATPSLSTSYISLGTETTSLNSVTSNSIKPKDQPNLFTKYPFLEERISEYCQKYCSISFDEAKYYISLGEQLEEKISKTEANNYFEQTLKLFANSRAAICLIWLFMAKAASYNGFDGRQLLPHGKAFTDGAFRIEDPDHKLERFLKLCATTEIYHRISTDMKEYLKKGQKAWSFDLDSQLPAKKRSILFIRLAEDQPNQYSNTLYIKLKKYGRPPLFKSIFTFLPNLIKRISYAKARLSASSSTISKIKCDRNTHVKPTIQEEFTQTIKFLCEEKITIFQRIAGVFRKIFRSLTEQDRLSQELSRLSQEAPERGCNHGISEMRDILNNKVFEALTDPVKNQKRGNTLQTLNALLEQAIPSGYRGKIKGNEVALPPLGKSLFSN